MSDQVAALVQRLPSCVQLVETTGAWSQYSADCLVRHLTETGWAGALALGLDPAAVDLVVVAGIGTLTLTPTGQEWQPAARQGHPEPQPLPAPPELARARLEACAACEHYRHARCTMAGCGCNGAGQRARLLSRCPIGRWPDQPR